MKRFDYDSADRAYAAWNLGHISKPEADELIETALDYHPDAIADFMVDALENPDAGWRAIAAREQATVADHVAEGLGE